jgi:hypothetical protein
MKPLSLHSVVELYELSLQHRSPRIKSRTPQILLFYRVTDDAIFTNYKPCTLLAAKNEHKKNYPRADEMCSTR